MFTYISANLHRRQLTVSQQSIAMGKATELIERLQKEAKNRMQAGGGDRKSKAAKSGVVTLPPPVDSGKTRDKLGKLAGDARESPPNALLPWRYQMSLKTI